MLVRCPAGLRLSPFFRANKNDKHFGKHSPANVFYKYAEVQRTPRARYNETRCQIAHQTKKPMKL